MYLIEAANLFCFHLCTQVLNLIQYWYSNDMHVAYFCIKTFNIAPSCVLSNLLTQHTCRIETQSWSVR